MAVLWLLALNALLALPALGQTSPEEVDSGKVRVVLNASEYSITKDKSGFDVIQMEGFTEASSPGDPILPHKIYNVLVPPEAIGSEIKLEVISADIQLIDGTYDIKPGWPSAIAVDGYIGGNITNVYWGEGTNIVDGKNLNVYEKDANYPEDYVEMLPYSNMRKWKFARVDFTPFQYNPVSKRLSLIKSVVVDISYEMSPTRLEQSLAADTAMDDIAAKFFFNYDDAKIWYETNISDFETLATYDYVIITTNAIVSNSAKLDAFIAHKQSLGYSVKVVTESDFGVLTGQPPDHKAERIRQWLKNNYASMGIKYVLLIGDPHPYESGEGDIPMKMCYPTYDGTVYQVPTDFFYADLTGNWDLDGDLYYGETSDYTGGGVDFTREVYVGRIPVYGTAYSTLDNILQKIINYESSYSTGWRKSILMPMSFSDQWTDGGALGDQMRDDYLNSYGYSSWRMYQQGSGACGLNSAYTSEQELRGGTGVRDRWAANDYGVMCWWGHGSATSTSVGYSGCWDGTLFQSSYCTSLDDGHPSFTYQCSCTNAYPENSDNLAYAILKQGGISTVSASRVSIYWVGQNYGTFDGSDSNSGIGYEYIKRLVTEESPGGDALYNTKMSISPSITMLMNWYDFNVYGDPSVSLKRPTGWFDLGGYVSYLPNTVVDDQGKTHIFTANPSGVLWDNIDGTWYRAGGVINCAPYAVKDSYGKIHVFATAGSDRVLYDFVLDTATLSGSWYLLGGRMASSVPSAILDPAYPNYIQVMVRSASDVLYRMQLYTPSMTGNWYKCGGVITTSPYVISDTSGNLHTFVRGKNLDLWDCKMDAYGGISWYGFGGILNTLIYPTAVQEPGWTDYVDVMVRGNDNHLKLCEITPSMSYNWRDMGGILTSDAYVFSDTGNRIHTFVRGSNTGAYENVYNAYPYYDPSGNMWYGQGGSILNFHPVGFANGFTAMVVIGKQSDIWKKVYSTVAPSTSALEESEVRDEGVEYEISEPVSSFVQERGDHSSSLSGMEARVEISVDLVPLDVEDMMIEDSGLSSEGVVKPNGFIT